MDWNINNIDWGQDENEKICFIFNLDLGEMKNVSFHEYEYKYNKNNNRNNGPIFGNLLFISDSCLSNNNSFIFGKNFKVINYEVFSVYFSSFN